MKRLILILIILLLAGCSPFWGPRANAAQWCEWNGSFPENCVRDRDNRVEIDGMWRAIDIQNLTSLGYYELVTLPNPVLQDGNMFTDWNYSFDGTQITRERNQGVNPDAPTAKDLKVQKAYQFINIVTEEKNKACQIGDYTLSQENVDDVIEAVATGRDRSYIVFNNVTGYHEVITRTAAQAATLYSQCIADEDAAVVRFDTLITDITACTGTVSEVQECLNLIQWVEAEPSTIP